MGNAGYNLGFEPNPRKHLKGALGMARSQDLNSGSCQFYIMLDKKENLDGSYVVFGMVTEGMDVVEQLRAKDSILKIIITK
jgi:cyclophilin family peptidyl-prolyl cis-trans isomerase